MTTTTVSRKTRSRVTSTPLPNATSSVPPPPHLSVVQQRELEAELRRELAALERRLNSDRQAESAETQLAVAHSAEAVRRTSDIIARRDVLATALARLTSGEYGACSRCGEPIPYGRLVVLPEATQCLACSGRS